MTTKVELEKKTIAALQRTVKKQAKRIAELEAAAVVDNAVRPIDGAPHLTTPLPANVFPWDKQS